MYAVEVWQWMQRAIEETNRRREKQVAYNKANGVDPQPLRKRIADILDQLVREDAETEQLIGGAGRQQSRGKAPVPGLASRARATAAQAAAARVGAELSESNKGGGVARTELIGLITELTAQMHAAAAELEFEDAARIRDEIKELKHELRGLLAAGG